MQLSERLSAVASLVTEGSRLADVGTDHAYLPIWLYRNGRIQSAIAMDVKTGPLQRAQEHIRREGLEAHIQIRLSDGLKALNVQEADSVVIAGMGGPLTVRILEGSREHWPDIREWVLQPQSEQEKVREFLVTEGFWIVREDMVEEDGKYYPMLRAVPKAAGTEHKERTTAAGTADTVQERWEPYELRYGKRLLEAKHPVLRAYLLRERGKLRRVHEMLAGRESETAKRRCQELADELIQIEEALKRYEM